MKIRNTKKMDAKWEDMFNKLTILSRESRFEPTDEEDGELARWYRTQKTLSINGKLINDRKIKFETVKFESSLKEKIWFNHFEDLKNYRREHPDRWPNRKKDYQSQVGRRLSIFCQMIRKNYRDNTLPEYWIEKFKQLDFNFNDSNDKWIRSYYRIREIVQNRTTLSKFTIGPYTYYMIYRYYRNSEGSSELTISQKKLIAELNLGRFFHSRPWDDSFAMTKDWVDKYGKLPTRISNKDLYGWLMNQKNSYKRGKLPQEQYEKLLSIGLDFNFMINLINEARWKEQFEALKIFRQQNPNRWPSYGGSVDEKKLNNWCQNARQLQAGTLPRRTNKLADWQIEMLKSIGFNWTLNEINNKLWLVNYEKLRAFLSDSSSPIIHLKIDGKINPMYTWVRAQKLAYKRGGYDAEKYKKLVELGIKFDLIARA